MCDTQEPPSKTACRVEVLGKVSSMHYDHTTSSCLVSTVLNGTHVFNLDDDFYGANLSTGVSARSVETYPYHAIGDAPLLSSTFFNAGVLFAVGSSSGTVTVVSRRSRAITASYAAPDCLPMRSLHAVAEQPDCLLTCSERGADLIDVERSQLLASLQNPAAGRAVAAVPLAPYTFAVANYDGKVLLYDTRQSHQAASVLTVPDQITCLNVAADTAQVCVGTVSGRVMTLRCALGSHKEHAFGLGMKRAPVRCIAMEGGCIAAGDLAGRLAIVDTADVPNPTVYWTAEALLRAPRYSVVDPFESSAVATGAEAAAAAAAAYAVAESEVTATAFAQGTAWMSFCSPKSNASHIVAVPA